MRKPATPEEEEVFFQSARERILPVARKRIQGPGYEDVVQETLMVLKEKLPGVENDADILPFVFMTLRNRIGNYYQKVKTEKKYIDFSEAREPAIRQDDSGEWSQVLEKALEHLKSDHARCAELLRAVLRSAELPELKQLLATDEANVYRTLYRCRSRLKTIITDILKVRLP